MSKKSSNCLYLNVRKFAHELLCDDNNNNPLRKAFAEHLLDVSKAIHYVKQTDNDNNDHYNNGDEIDIIEKVLRKEKSTIDLETAIEKTYEMIENE